MSDFRKDFFRNANRVVFTTPGAFNPKNKKSNQIIADIRNAQQINEIFDLLEIDFDPNPVNTGWMSPPDYTITSMKDKDVIDSLNIVLKSYIRKTNWKSDYALVHDKDYQSWLLSNGINVPSI